MRPLLIAVPLCLLASAAYADGCAKERDLNATEMAWVKQKIAAAEAVYPPAPAGWARYQVDAGLQPRVHADPLPGGLCDDYGSVPLMFSAHATYTPADSALIKDLAWQRADSQRKKKQEDLQQQMTAAGQRGDYQAMTRLSQEMQAVSGPVGSKPATPMSDEEVQKKTDELNRKLEQAQAKNDYAAMQKITAEQMALLMRQAGVDTSGVADATPTSDQINAAPRVHVVVDFNRNSFEIPEGAKKISYGGAVGGVEYSHDGWCFDEGGPKQKAEAVLLFGNWKLTNDFKNDPRVWMSPAAEKGPRTSLISWTVTVCGDPATVDKLLPAIKYSAIK